MQESPSHVVTRKRFKGFFDKISTKSRQTQLAQLSDADVVGDGSDVPEPTTSQLKLYFFGNFVPFFFFGFFDNSIMLICGDFFDMYLGTTLGISTLAAAAMGNIVGDVSGIWLGGTVEFIVGKVRTTFEPGSAAVLDEKTQTLRGRGWTVRHCPPPEEPHAGTSPYLRAPARSS